MNISLVKVMRQIGLTPKHALIYQALITGSGVTPLQLARITKLNRTSLYRYLEEMRERSLVTNIMGDKTSRYTARPEGLTQCLASEEIRVEELRKTIPTLVEELGRERTRETTSEVKYYQGRRGLQQMLWNVVASGNDYAGVGYEEWNTSVGRGFAEQLRAKNMESGAKSREITNDPSGDYGYTKLGKSYAKVFEHRRIDPKILEIKHDTYIYGEVFAYYYHYQGEYFGVEIHNPQIARTELQMFEILWKMAEKR